MTTELRRRLLVPAKHLGLVLIGFVMLYPVLWMVVSSLRPGDEIFRSPGLILDSLHTENYVEGWNALNPSFGTYLVNSTILVLGCIVGNLVSCSMAAYAFARLNFSGKRWWFGIMLGTIMLPIHVIIVPQYVLFSNIGWVN
ncbi:MAG TPA: carbohydrate ABC transporter permease, partial [Lentzea sp.]